MIPPEITILTGITQAMVVPAPRVEHVLPAWVEFSAGAVVVGHNVRFDVSFLDAALLRRGWPRVPPPIVDTVALARRLIRDEVPNCRLGTLASRLRLDHRPTHRALDDALATTDLLHLLLERAAAYGVLGLDDLLALPKMDAHPQARKLRLTTSLPRAPGVYLFVDSRGAVLYVGKATNLRQRVRSYFSTDERRKVHGLLREAVAIRHVLCESTLEAAVAEIRLIHEHQPRYNRQGRRERSYHYVKLTLGEAFPRLAVVRTAPSDGGLYLGPLPSAAAARAVTEAIQTAAPLRRCAEPLARDGPPRRDHPCTPAQLGVATCPCAGAVDRAAYETIVQRVRIGLTEHADLLLTPLTDRLAVLARAQRFEEAADVRDRAAALVRALERQRRFDALRRAGTVRLGLPGGGTAELHGGVLRSCDSDRPGQARLPLGPDPPGPDVPVPRAVADELACVAAWLEAEAARVKLIHCDEGLSAPIERLPSFSPRR